MANRNAAARLAAALLLLPLTACTGQIGASSDDLPELLAIEPAPDDPVGAECSECSADSKSAPSCDALGYAGICVGDTSIWWEDGECRVRDCASEGRACDFIDESVGWGCLGGTDGAKTVSCADIGFAGLCAEDGTLVWFEQGQCHWEHCPLEGGTCGEAAQTGASCLD